MIGCFQINVKVETICLDRNGIDYVGANYLSDMLMNNFYITSLVRIRRLFIVHRVK